MVYIYFVLRLFVKLPRPRDSKVTFSFFEPSCHLLLYLSNHSKVWEPVNCIAYGHNQRTCWRSSSQVATCYYSCLTTQRYRGISLIAFPKNTTSELVCMIIPLMRKVKTGNDEYQLFQSFGLTRPENWTWVNQLLGGRSNHETAML